MMSCPHCGAPLPPMNPGAVMAVCQYCSSVVVWDHDGLREAGRKSQLSEGFTTLYRDATGSLNGARFRVEGRVRYSFGKGFWDEWYVSFEDGTAAWLTEDDHELALQRPVEAPPGDPSGLTPGQAVQIAGANFVITEVGEAVCLGVEGQLPKAVLPDESYRYADGSSPDGRFSLGIEMDETPPSVFVGEWLPRQALSLDGDGGFG